MSTCRACSGSLKNEKPDGTVKTCRRCGALHLDTINWGRALEYVRLGTLVEPPAGTELRFFSAENIVCSAGIKNIHGWFDPETKLVAQYG